MHVADLARPLCRGASAASGRVALLRDGRVLWTADHRGVEQVALGGAEKGGGPAPHPTVVLTCGSDGHVRAWGCDTGDAVGHASLDLPGGKEGGGRAASMVDRMADGGAVVQLVGASSAPQARAGMASSRAAAGITFFIATSSVLKLTIL